MKEAHMYAVISIACGLLFLGSLATDFSAGKPVHEMWISDVSPAGNLTSFTLNVKGPQETQIAAVFVDNVQVKTLQISIPYLQEISLPVGQGEHTILVKLYDEKKGYDEFGSKAKPYAVFFRAG